PPPHSLGLTSYTAKINSRYINKPQGGAVGVFLEPVREPATIQGHPAEPLGCPANIQGHPAKPPECPAAIQGCPALVQGHPAKPSGHPADIQGCPAHASGRPAPAHNTHDTRLHPENNAGMVRRKEFL
ncbi:MAG: hypothetical protein LBK73_13635, partial [Treponema sp.]|nr:hypothetical protein [Treponema sp.]